MKKNDGFEISIYSGELTKEGIGESVKKIMDSYPGLPEGFYMVFSDRIYDHKFSNERLKDAVNHVIDNCIYPQPTIAQFVSYDKRIEVFNFSQMQKKTDSDKKAFERYKAVQLEGLSKPMWASLENIELYKLKEWKP